MFEEIYAACLTYEPSLSDFADFKSIKEPVWLMGKEYNVQNDDEFENLTQDLKSRIWCTYRRQFSPIGDSNLTSDAGWGCMHRCGQMLMGEALITKYLGRDWVWNPDCLDEQYQNILREFNDKDECQYSIHKIASKGCTLEKQIGEWFGPNTVVQVLKRLAEEDRVNNIAVHVAMDSTVIKSEIRKLFVKENESRSSNSFDSSSNSENYRPVLLAVPLRLGLYEIMPLYFEKLKASFTMKQSLGIIGGKTNHASYYIGYVDKELIYLDPHTTQMHKDDPEDSTYHCSYPSRMPFSMLDPSIALCFYLKDIEDFEEWCQKAQQHLLEPEKDALFEVMEEKPPLISNAEIIGIDDFNITLEDTDRIYTSDEEFELLM